MNPFVMRCGGSSYIGDNVRKTLILRSAIVTILIITIPLQPSYAGTLTKSYEGPDATITFRDIFNTGPTPDPTISFDKPFYHNGDAGTLTITDFNANLDVNSKDSITAKVGNNMISLEETDVNTAIFEGNFIAGPSNTVEYFPEPADAVRAAVKLSSGEIDPQGSITITDTPLTFGDGIGCPDGREIVAEAVNIDFTNIGPYSIDSILISYANAVLADPLNNPVVLEMYYQKDVFSSYERVTDRFETSFATEFDVDEDGDGIMMNLRTNDDIANNILSPLTPLGSGNYVLVINVGCGGGVGGGIKAGGLVFNALAATVAGNTGTDVTPPSLVFSRPTTGLKFTDALLGSIFAPDPLKPIAPTTDSSTVTPLKIDDNGYFLTGYANTIDPKPVNTGDDVALTLSFLEATSVQHVALHFVDASTDEMSDTDPMITFDNGNVVKSDPNGVLGDQISFTTSKDGIHSMFNFVFSFDEPTKRHLMINAWDEKRNSANTKVFDAFDISGTPVPQNENHLLFDNLGQYVITQDGVTDLQAQNIIQENPVVGFYYSDSIGRIDRHDMAKLYDTIDNEKTRAGNVVDDNFQLDKNTFVVEDKKSSDTNRAPELTWSNVGHKLKDNTKSQSENEESLKGYCWQEHLRAEKTLKSLLVGSKYHQD